MIVGVIKCYQVAKLSIRGKHVHTVWLNIQEITNATIYYKAILFTGQCETVLQFSMLETILINIYSDWLRLGWIFILLALQC